MEDFEHLRVLIKIVGMDFAHWSYWNIRSFNKVEVFSKEYHEWGLEKSTQNLNFPFIELPNSMVLICHCFLLHFVLVRLSRLWCKVLIVDQSLKAQFSPFDLICWASSLFPSVSLWFHAQRLLL